MSKSEEIPKKHMEETPTKRFDGKWLIKDTLVLNSIVFSIILIQYIAFPVLGESLDILFFHFNSSQSFIRINTVFWDLRN